jgi:MFS family permease
MLRFLSFLVGLVITVVMAVASSAAEMMSFQSESPTAPGSVFLTIFPLAILFSAGYFFVGAYGDRVVRSPVLRVIAGVLIAGQIAATATPLLQGKHPEVLPLLAPILVFSLVLFSAFSWPAWFKPRSEPTTLSSPENER